RREGVEDVPAAGGVGLPRPGHAGADALLEVLARGHGVLHSRGAAGLHAPMPPRRAMESTSARTSAIPRTAIPFAPAGPGRVETRSGGRAREPAGPDCTTGGRRQQPPGLVDVRSHLGDELLDVGEGGLAAEAGGEADRDPVAVEVAVEV